MTAEIMTSLDRTNLYHAIDDLRLPSVGLFKYLKKAGFKTSTSMVSKLRTKGEWPKNYSKADIEHCKQEIEIYLVNNGATSAHTDDLWMLANGKPDYIPDNETYYEVPEPEMLSNNTKRFFKLRHNIFENEINCEDDVFMAENHQLVLEEVLSTAFAGSMAALIGECGSGKTILRRAFISRIERDHPDVVLIQPSRLDRSKITAGTISLAICHALQIQKVGRSAEERDAAIEQALIASANNGNLHLLLIDEAHDLTVEVIKILKRFWELTHGYKRVIGIVLMGQPELKRKLESQHVREFTWRCNQIEMRPLGLNTPDYIRHKFKCGGSNADNFFDEEALQAVKDKCAGKIKQGLGFGGKEMDMSYPLHVNAWLCKAMNMAAQIGEKRITKALIERVK